MWEAIRYVAYVGLVLGYGLLMLLLIRRRDGRGQAQRYLEIIILLAATWTLALGIVASLPRGWSWPFLWHRIAQIGLIVLAFLTADFADAFVQRPPRRWGRLGVVGALSLIAVGLDVFLPALPIDFQLTPAIHIGPTQLATFLLAMAWLVSTVAAWWTCAVAFRHATTTKHRNRLRYLGVSLISFAVGDLLVLMGGIPDVYVGLAARLLGFAIAAFAVLRYDLPDVHWLSLLALRVALLSGLTALFYLFVVLAVGYASGVFSSRAGWVWVGSGFGLALLLAAMVDVLLSPRLRRLFDRIILRRAYDVQSALRDYSQQISLILDLDRLTSTTLDWLRTTLQVPRSAFILFTPQDGNRIELRVLRAEDFPAPEPQCFSADSRFIAHFRNLGRPLSQYDLDMLSWFQTMPVGEQQWLQSLGVDLYVPMLVADTPVALLGLGPKASGQPYSDEDLETLTILAGQTGTALENARLVDDLRDVQEDLRQITSQLAETNSQLKRLDQTKTDFITIASHELRTPLTQIYGYSDVLKSLEGDELSDAQVVHRFIEGITRGAARLKHVVDAMVDMSLIETRALTLRPATVPVAVVVEDAVESVRSAADQRSLTWRVHDLSDLPCIEADGTRLEQVLVGLLTNAVKFTPDNGSIEISGRLASPSSDQSYVELQIADTGIGIDPDHRDLIFEKFYRAENPLLHSTDEIGFKGAGPGLGLAIAKGIVEAHGGLIWVESPGRNEKTCPGSTFHIQLPVNGPRLE
jgi:signal transduction histidine kinase